MYEPGCRGVNGAHVEQGIGCISSASTGREVVERSCAFAALPPVTTLNNLERTGMLTSWDMNDGPAETIIHHKDMNDGIPVDMSF